MKIQVTIKNVYGKETIYPACDTAKTFAAIARQTTLTMREIMFIKNLGYSVEVVQPVVTL